MRVLSAVHAVFAMALILLGLVTVFGIGITGLLFLFAGAILAALAALAQENSRAAAALTLAVDALLAYMAVRKLAALSALESPRPCDYVPLDWRALRKAPWF
jgi:hypothetical protein